MHSIQNSVQNLNVSPHLVWGSCIYICGSFSVFSSSSSSNVAASLGHSLVHSPPSLQVLYLWGEVARGGVAVAPGRRRAMQEVVAGCCHCWFPAHVSFHLMTCRVSSSRQCQPTIISLSQITISKFESNFDGKLSLLAGRLHLPQSQDADHCAPSAARRG